MQAKLNLKKVKKLNNHFEMFGAIEGKKDSLTLSDPIDIFSD